MYRLYGSDSKTNHFRTFPRRSGNFDYKIQLIICGISRFFFFFFTYWRIAIKTLKYNDFLEKKQKFFFEFSLFLRPFSSLLFNIFSRVLLLDDTNLEDKCWSDFGDSSAWTDFERRTNLNSGGHDIIVFCPNNDQISTL